MDTITGETVGVEVGPTPGDQQYPEDQDVAGGLEVEREEGGMVGVGGSDHERDTQGTTSAARVVRLNGTVHTHNTGEGIENMDGRGRLACDLLADSFIQLAKLQLKIEVRDNGGDLQTGKWRFEQDKIIQFLSKETWAHTLTGRSPRECYSKALEIVR
mgnify:CR=1 FL=1